MGSTPGLGRSPAKRSGNPLQESRLKKIATTKEPGELESMRLQRVGHDLGTEQQYYIVYLKFAKRVDVLFKKKKRDSKVVVVFKNTSTKCRSHPVLTQYQSKLMNWVKNTNLDVLFS